MIENFLTTQWRAGALQRASTPEHGLLRRPSASGQTMTPHDVLEGRMIVENRHGRRAAGRIHHPALLSQAGRELMPRCELGRHS